MCRQRQGGIGSRADLPLPGNIYGRDAVLHGRGPRQRPDDDSTDRPVHSTDGDWSDMSSQEVITRLDV